MSHTEGIPSRRRLLAGATAALASAGAAIAAARGSPIASPEGAGDDAELIRLCKCQDEAWALVIAIQSEKRPPGVDRGITPWSEDKEERLADADDEYLDLIEQIAEIPSTTAAGLHAKVRTMLGVLERVVGVNISARTPDDFATNEEAMVEHRMTLSLARDVLAIVGRDAA